MHACGISFYIPIMIFKISRFLVFVLMGCLVVTCSTQAQQPSCNTITANMNYTVKSVKIVGRWVSKELQSNLEQVIGLGQTFDPATLSAGQELVRDEIIKGEEEFAIRLKGSTSILYITTDACPVADSTGVKQVQVTIHPYYLRIDLYNIGNNILPIPRTAKSTFYKEVPPLLMATSPFLGLVNDRSFGTYAYVQTATDLLHIPGKYKPPDSSSKNLLNLDLNFRKSLSAGFYNFAGALQFIHPVSFYKNMGWNLGIMYAKGLLPLQVNNYDGDLTKIFASVNGNGKILFMDKYVISGGIDFSQNKYSLLNAKYQNPETAYDFSALGDGRAGNGFARLGVWFNAGVPRKDINLQSYQRIGGKLGYAVPIGRGHNIVDLETSAGLGYTWGTPPPYSSYFAGSESPGFLYAPLQSLATMPFPSGPVIRSLGEREGGLFPASVANTGGTSYWGINLNFSIPITKWSRPLIPDIVIQEEDPHITMRSAVKGQVNTAESFIADDLALNQGLSDDAVDSAAERIVNRDIRPTINYLADKANIYSIKPVLYFDLGEISNHRADNRVWAATGAGLQINIVNARLDIGYIQTLSPKSDASKGNFLLRFSVQNFY